MFGIICNNVWVATGKKYNNSLYNKIVIILQCKWKKYTNFLVFHLMFQWTIYAQFIIKMLYYKRDVQVRLWHNCK